MKRNWDREDLITHFTLIDADIQWLSGRNAINQTGAAVLLKCFQYLGYFPVIEYISVQLGFPASLYDQYDWSGRSAK